MTAPRRVTIGLLIGGGLLVALALAFFVSPFASNSPDGLEKVAAEKSIDSGERDHLLADGPLADYSLTSVDNDRLSTGLAGVIGVGVTFAVGLGLFVVVRQVRTRSGATSPINQAATTSSAAVGGG